MAAKHCSQAWYPGFDPQNPRWGKRTISWECPSHLQMHTGHEYISTHAHKYMHTYNVQLNNLNKLIFWNICTWLSSFLGSQLATFGASLLASHYNSVLVKQSANTLSVRFQHFCIIHNYTPRWQENSRMWLCMSTEMHC